MDRHELLLGIWDRFIDTSSNQDEIDHSTRAPIGMGSIDQYRLLSGWDRLIGTGSYRDGMEIDRSARAPLGVGCDGWIHVLDTMDGSIIKLLDTMDGMVVMY